MKNGQGFARQINLKNLQQFAPLLARKSKSEVSVAGDDEQDQVSSTTKGKSKPVDPEIAKAEALFAGKKFNSSVPFTPPTKHKASASGVPAKRASGGRQAVPTSASSTTAARGMLRWEKELTPTDAQRQDGNPTGDIRLTRAEWRVNGKLIAWRTYFRKNVFGKAAWRRKNAKVEQATVEFNVIVLGQNYGINNLVVSHKPSGASGQGNYTTGIQWGNLTGLTKRIDLTGRTLRLYDPAAGETAFTLEIV